MQRFPDSYHFAGDIQCKHRQIGIGIGNAMPPPADCLRAREEAIDAKAKR
jgi:DNA (cytosine-5)-methyltransferase 1